MQVQNNSYNSIATICILMDAYNSYKRRERKEFFHLFFVHIIIPIFSDHGENQLCGQAMCNFRYPVKPDAENNDYAKQAYAILIVSPLLSFFPKL